jgi:hypothetical protein
MGGFLLELFFAEPGTEDRTSVEHGEAALAAVARALCATNG